MDDSAMSQFVSGGKLRAIRQQSRRDVFLTQKRERVLLQDYKRQLAYRTVGRCHNLGYGIEHRRPISLKLDTDFRIAFWSFHSISRDSSGIGRSSSSGCPSRSR